MKRRDHANNCGLPATRHAKYMLRGSCNRCPFNDPVQPRNRALNLSAVIDGFKRRLSLGLPEKPEQSGSPEHIQTIRILREGRYCRRAPYMALHKIP